MTLPKNKEILRNAMLGDGGGKSVVIDSVSHLATERRYLDQRNALIALTKDAPREEFEFSEACRRLTQTTARTLGVARASIWRYTPDRTAIECLDLYELETGIHSSGQVLVAAEYPAYFEALSCMELIAADDARSHHATREFASSYLAASGITAMLDVPVHFKESVNHILCCEHVGPRRLWAPDEKTFAVAVGNLVSLALESTERARAQREVAWSHQRFESVAAATNDTIWDWNLETDVLWWNDGAAKLFGWAAPEQPISNQMWIRQIHPEDRARVVDGIYAFIQGAGTYWSDEYRFVSNDGTVAHVLDRGQVIRDGDGKGIRMVGGMTDLTTHKISERELVRSHRALRMLSSCNEMLIRTSEEVPLLAEACRLAVEVGGYHMAWAGYATNSPEKRVMPAAHAGQELGYLSEVTISWADDHSSGAGPVGQAIRSGVPVIFEDVIGNPAFSYWLAPARKRGYRSVICLPLRKDAGVFGVLCLYGAEPQTIGVDEVKLLQEMANDLAFGISNIRNRQESQRAQEVVLKVAQAVSSGNSSEFFDLLTRNMVEAVGALGGLVGRFDPMTHAIETISYVFGGQLMDNITYSLLGTPCENVMDGDICIFDRNIQSLFPDDHILVELGMEAYAGIPLFQQDGMVAGIMAVFFGSPLVETSLVESTLKIFAARAASELDRQQADARIREQASLLDKARDAILVRDLNHVITYWNKGAERLYGWSAEEAVGKSVKDLLYRDPAVFNRAHSQTLEYGEWLGELAQVNKVGRDLVIEGRWTLVRDEKGRPESVFVLNTDISEHRKLEQQFLRAQRLESIGTLAGGIAHDLNNILAPISMSIELLKMRIEDDRSRELLETIAKSAKRGSDMVGQVLSFARGMEGRRVEVHPRQLVREIETILRDTFLRQTLLRVDASRELWTVHGDPTQLHQVILNLCVNARDAVGKGGEISITATNVEIDESFAAVNLEAKEGPHVCIEVRDSGMGISPEIMDKIFDPFFTTKSVGKGTGLGLSTSLAIVKSHGGFIRASSRPEDGTRFKVYLPANPGPSPGILKPPPAAIPSGSGELVLVVDDEESIRRITRQTLEAFGYRTLLAANGEEAVFLYMARRDEVAVVLTDMMMPVMDGAVTIARLKEINPEVRIIASSGITSNRDIANDAVKGTLHFLQKPYTAERLLNCLKEVLCEPLRDP